MRAKKIKHGGCGFIFWSHHMPAPRLPLIQVAARTTELAVPDGKPQGSFLAARCAAKKRQKGEMFFMSTRTASH